MSYDKVATIIGLNMYKMILNNSQLYYLIVFLIQITRLLL